MSNNKDSNHIEIPSSGMMVREDYELVQLIDSCIYVLPSNNNMCEELVQKIYDKLLSSSDTLLNHYDVDFLEELPCMDNHPNLSSALATGRYNIIMGMNEPGSASGKQYLLLQSSDSSIDTDMAAMIKISEQITSESVKQLMFRHAMFSHESFIRSTDHIWESDGFWKNFIVRRFGELLGGGVIGVVPGFRGGLGIHEVLTHRKRMELQSKFIDNMLKLKNEQLNLDVRNEARKEVKIVLDCLNLRNQDMISYLASKPRDFIEDFYGDLSPMKIAEHSNLKMEIRGNYKIDKKKRTLGKFRLFLLKDNQKCEVQFGRRVAFIVYLIYLMDVVGSETVDTLDIRNYRVKFCDIYNNVYGHGGKEDFDTLLGEGNANQKMFHQCYKDIRGAIGNACEYLHERSTPFVLNDSNSHLYIKKDHVIIEKETLTALVKSAKT